jgi:hypothetical protein
LLIYVLFKSKSRKRDLGFFIAYFGFTLVVETVVYVFLKAYEYYPLVIPNSPKNDGVFGNLVSQFSISSVALFISVFEVSFKGVVLSSASFYFIEKLFLALGIYKHYWYKAWITFVGLLILFQFAKKWYSKLSTDNSKLVYYLTCILGILSLYLPTTNWIGILTGYFDIKDNIVADPYISHAVIAIPKYLIQINLYYFLYKRRSKWIWYLSVFTVMLIADTILYYNNLLYVKDGFIVIYTAISLASVFFYVYIMAKLLSNKN